MHQDLPAVDDAGRALEEGLYVLSEAMTKSWENNREGYYRRNPQGD